MEYLTIAIPVRAWQLIDGTVDNSMAIDVVDGVMESVIAGSCVRDAGWRSSAGYTGARDSFGWPPEDHPLEITLRRGHWEWIRSQIERWEPLSSNTEPELSDACARIDGALRRA
ncbi:hypothetical protein DY023_06875 [Microbacterium bovistercoris]|uniref:Uncharacterized protein n=1 Tax=Microbacterium bovistercoris TaxID=2293570 RepID=A0A371NUR3_9MICO|nr:hypothetical protein [Microbacterium bovistercoris]REJ06190.1 hypothetical protein DY023_06875 [Microbacterium bovistercoris]